MLEIVRNLVYARYQYIKGDPNALDMVKSAIKSLHSTPSKQKQLLQFALDTYDIIKTKTRISSYEQIDYITSKISTLLLLPFPPCGLPTVDDWGATPWKDPEFPPQCGWQRLVDIPELMALNPGCEMLRPGEVLQQAKNGGDCSLVCAMISIYTYKQDILNRIVFPASGSGEPRFTPSGHYIVKLLIGGVWRMVDVDDYIPWSEQKVIITKRGSFLPILLEKAYLKAMGGYDFRGSNAALDTYQLCGGLPSFYSLQHRDERHVNTCYDDLLKVYHERSALVCVGTGLNAPSELERNHDFAIVDMRADQTLELINPWNDRPTIHKWQQVQEQFHVLYVNANPFHYPHVSQFNEILKTSASYAPKDVSYYFPQFVVTNPSQTETASAYFTITVKPTSHKMSTNLQLLAFESSSRLIFTREASLFAETPQVDALCLSIKLDLPPLKQLTVVASVRDAISDIDTVALHLQFSAKQAIEVKKLSKPHGLKTLRGQFSPVAGRNGHPQYLLNPCYLLKISSKCAQLRLFLMAQDHPTQVAVFAYDGRKLPRSHDQIASSGPYTSGMQFLIMHDVRPGTYFVVASLYQPARVPFYISCLCECEYAFEPYPAVTSGYFENGLHCDANVKMVRVHTKRPTKIVAYVSENGTIDVSQTIVNEELFINVTLKHGESFDLEVYSEHEIVLSAVGA